MRVMVLVKATEDSEKGFVPTAENQKLMEAMGQFNDALRKAGILVTADVDGPFGAARELVAGFWIWDVKNMDEAVAWVKRCPNPMPGPSEIEIRPFYEMADFQ